MRLLRKQFAKNEPRPAAGLRKGKISIGGRLGDFVANKLYWFLMVLYVVFICVVGVGLNVWWIRWVTGT